MDKKNYNIRLDLSKVPSAFVHTIQGSKKNVKCVCIPIEENNIFISETTKRIYWDIQAKSLANSNYGQSHALKPRVGSERWKTMTEEERNAIPFIGNMSPIEGKPQEQQQQERARTADEVYGNKMQVQHNSFDDNDIPF